MTKTLGFERGDQPRITQYGQAIRLDCSYTRRPVEQYTRHSHVSLREVGGIMATYEGTLTICLGKDILEKMVNKALRAGILGARIKTVKSQDQST